MYYGGKRDEVPTDILLSVLSLEIRRSCTEN